MTRGLNRPSRAAPVRECDSEEEVRVDPYEWADASVTYPDWVGTAQLDQRATAPGVAAAVGLDPERWLVVGIDIGGGEHAHHLHVVAVDQTELRSGEGLSELAAANGGQLPVTDFLIHDADPYAVLKAITHMFQLRLRVRGLAAVPIQVVALADGPDGWSEE